MRIYLLGFMGSGKTYWGKKLSQSLGLSLVDLDQEIVFREGKDIPEIFEKLGEMYFRTLEHKYLKSLSEQENILISCGGGTPCFSDNISFMNENGRTIWLDVPTEVIVNRLKRGRKKRPLLTGLNEEQLRVFVQKKLTERTPFYAQSHLIVNPIKYTVESLTSKIQSCENLI